VVSDSTLIGGGNPPPALATVLIVDNDFPPSLAVVRIGGIVAWVWGPGVTEQHNVTFADSTRSSPTQTQGTHSVTFSTAGTFAYSCTIHHTMSVSVVVR
jgi:plastocyanin